MYFPCSTSHSSIDIGRIPSHEGDDDTCSNDDVTCANYSPDLSEDCATYIGDSCVYILDNSKLNNFVCESFLSSDLYDFGSNEVQSTQNSTLTPIDDQSLDFFPFIEVQSPPSLNPIDSHITSMHPQSELTKKQERTSLKFAEQSLPKVSLPLMCNRDRILSLFRACQEKVLLKGRSKEVVLAACIHAELSLFSPTSVKILKNIVSAYTNIPITEENIRPVIKAMKQNDYFGLYTLNNEPARLNIEPTSDVIVHLSHHNNVDDVHKKEIITLAETILHDIFFRKLKKNKGKTNEAVAVYFALCTISLKYNYPTITLKDYFNNIVEAAREVLGRRQLPLLKSLRTNLDRIIQDNASILQQHGVRWFS